MKPFIENVLNTTSSDWTVREYHCRVHKQEFSCSWHYHNEYELVLYQDPHGVFNGSYLAGDAIGEIHHNTALLYGPGLPHMLTGQILGTEEKAHHSIIVWFKQPWIEKLQATIPEARHIKRLLEQASYGVKFSADTSQKVAELLSGIEAIERQYQAVRVIEVLLLLSNDSEYLRLSSSPYRLKQLSGDQDAYQKVERATRFIEENYNASIKISDLCKALHISESSAYRLFEKHYGMSFSDHVKQFRIGKACELLASTSLPISLIAERTGFQNLSNFNRQFKAVKEMTPSTFRSRF